MRTRRQLLTTTTATCLVAIAGCFNFDVVFESEPNAGDSPDQALTILEHELVRSNAGTMAETVSVEGRAENTAENRLSHV